MNATCQPAMTGAVYPGTAQRALATAFADDYVAQRAGMVDEVGRYADAAGDDSLRQDVLQSMNSVERHAFVPRGQVPYAYENRPLRIGYGQTISQPYIVALMTDLLDPDPDDVVLEVGTGSGYQAAVLSGLVARSIPSKSSSRWLTRPVDGCNVSATTMLSASSATAISAGKSTGRSTRSSSPRRRRTCRRR
jgi:hypothetical protein